MPGSKAYRRRLFWSALLALYVLFIFSNSMKPAVASSKDSGWVLMMAREVLAGAGMGDVGITEHIIRKAAHFTEYALMGILLMRCLWLYEWALHVKVLISVILGYMAPFVDETIQLFVEGRSGQISDVWLDCAGVACGCLAFHLVRALFKRKEPVPEVTVKVKKTLADQEPAYRGDRNLGEKL